MKTLRDFVDEKTVKKGDTGVGDTLKRLTSAFGVKPCGGCKDRAEKLNQKFPYKK